MPPCGYSAKLLKREGKTFVLRLIRLKPTPAQGASGDFQNFTADLRARVCRADRDTAWWTYRDFYIALRVYQVGIWPRYLQVGLSVKETETPISYRT